MLQICSIPSLSFEGTNMEEKDRFSITGIKAGNPDAPSDEFRVEFYPDGKVKKVGYAVRAGLCEGRVYYPSGSLRELVYEGQAKIKKIGNASWPVVVFPEGFDHLHG